jgi:hypothetical protein
MSAEHYPEPIAEGFVHGGQRVVQLVAVAAAFRRGYARRVRRLRAAHEAGEVQAERAAALELKAAFEEARAQWTPAHDATWLRNADLLRVAQAWGAAIPYAEDSESASSAVRKCEERLRDLHPHAMSHYDRFRGDGQDPLSAMGQAAPYFTRDPNVRTGEPAMPRQGLAEGTGTRWAANVHGPDRAEWEEALQGHRAQAIATELRERLGGEGRDAHPDEIRTALELTTNLPEHIITEASNAEPGPQRPTQARLAAEDFPYSIEKTMELTSTRPPHAPPTRPASPSIDRDRHRNR